MNDFHYCLADYATHFDVAYCTCTCRYCQEAQRVAREARWGDSALRPVAAPFGPPAVAPAAMPTSTPVPHGGLQPGEAAGLAVAGLVATLAAGLAWGLARGYRAILARVRDIR